MLADDYLSSRSNRPSRRGLGASLIALVAARLRKGRLTLVTPDGNARDYVGEENGMRATVILRNGRIARRLALGGTVGLAESYMDGDWDSPDLAAFLELGAANEAAFAGKIHIPGWMRIGRRLFHARRENSKKNSRRNIAYHYDLGNAFYRQWLDATMTYSAALFRDGIEDLEQAQQEKYRNLCRMLDLRPGMSVLEIGCGWGGFAEIAASEFGCTVTCLTLSQEQHDFARERMACAGLAEKVDIRLQDYRDVVGQFDRIASIEMLEAVGEKYWPVYFDTLKARLKPGGRAAVQVITIDQAYFEDYRSGCDFIQRYIFPGGMLPTPEILADLTAKAGLRMGEQLFFGKDYGRTLALWNETFQAAWPKIKPLGFDRQFKRMWEYYLAYCEAGFRTGRIDVVQFAVHKD